MTFALNANGRRPLRTGGLRGGLLAAVAAAFALVSVAAPAVERVSVVGLFTNMAVVDIDGKRRTLRAGTTSPEGVKLISADSETAVLEVNGKRARYQLGANIGSTFAAPRELAVRIWPTVANMYEVSGLINGRSVDFVVDTGATLVSMNEHDATRLGVDYLLTGEEAVSSTAAGLAKIYLVNLTRVRVGEIEFRDVQAAVHEGEFPDRVLLGMSFLSRVDIRREGRMMELKKKF